MSAHHPRSAHRTRWAAVGAAVAVTLGAGSLGLVHATNPTDAVTFVAITPCRVFDTRTAFAIGPKTSPLGPNETHTVSTHGKNGECTGIPAGAVAISMNMTATDATAPTFLTVWAAGAAQPNSSNLNPVPGAPATPNAITTAVSATGQFEVYNLAGTVNVFADINGYYIKHNHDDRYYTKGQSDTALAEKADTADIYTKPEVDDLIAQDGPTAWGMARGDASLRVQSPNVVEVLHPGVGLYCVVFDPPLGNVLEAATISGAGSGPVMGENTNGQGGLDSCTGSATGGLELRIYNENGVLSDERFSFIVP